MRPTRRCVLSGLSSTVALGAFVSPLRGQGFAVDPRMDLRNFATDTARMQALQRGVGVMKSRPASDPTSWFFQAAIHGVSQDAIDQAERDDPGVANAARFWNQCPHHGEPSANFLLWHRTYLYYFERILRAASGSATLSLPYWNYTDGDRGFPVLFADPQPDSNNNPTNPLYDLRRENAFAGGFYTLSDGAVTTAPIAGEAEFFGPDESSGLAGGVADEASREHRSPVVDLGLPAFQAVGQRPGCELA